MLVITSTVAGCSIEASGIFSSVEAHVLEADFLADDVERHGRKALVHRAHHARQHRAVADAGVEHAQAPAGADGYWQAPCATRSATTHFSLQVLTNSRYFCRLS